MGHHDRYVFRFLSREENAAEFFTAFLPAALRDLVDMESVNLEQTRFVSSEHEDFFSDMLFTFFQGESFCKIYILLEHKSSPELDTLQQLRGYLNQAEDKYPDEIIIPVIFYHGPKAWNLKSSYQESKSTTMPAAIPLGIEYGLNFRPILINVRTQHTKDLLASFNLASFLQALIRSGEYNQGLAAREILLNYSEAPDQKTSLQNFQDLVIYIPEQYELDWNELVKDIGPKLPKEYRDIIMTAADKIKLEGRETRRETGRETRRETRREN